MKLNCFLHGSAKHIHDKAVNNFVDAMKVYGYEDIETLKESVNEVEKCFTVNHRNQNHTVNPHFFAYAKW